MKTVAVIVLEGAKPLDVGVPAQVFAHRTSMPYNVVLCGVQPGVVAGGEGIIYQLEHGLDVLASADLIVVPGYLAPDLTPPPGELIAALEAAHARGARLAALGTGAFALAAAGLLDGKGATTHWHYSRIFAEQFPLVRVEERALFVDEGQILTSAGSAAAVDLCLHVLRSDLGLTAANHAARRLVAAPYRSGGQRQFVARAVPEADGAHFAATREWALHRLHEPISVAGMAEHARVSPRTFSRRFVDETGYTPMRWVMRARLDLARELLEDSDLGVDEIAAFVGLGTGANLRTHFRRILGVAPSQYRSSFAH